MSSSTPPNLELGLYAVGADLYRADLTLSDVGSAAPADLATDVPVSLDTTALLTHALDSESYGSALTAMLFADGRLREAWATAKGYRQRAGGALRLRIRLDHADPALQCIRWELLRDPLTGMALATDEQVLLSRYLGSADAQPVLRRLPGPLRLLACIANPAELDQYRLSPVDVAGELARLHTVVSGAELSIIATGRTPGGASLGALAAGLRDGHDVLVLICHGAIRGGEAVVWLEDERGSTAIVPGQALATLLAQLARRPMLVILAACESAGDVTGHLLEALGPQLILAGVPAVVAMQGAISTATLATMLPVFFRELQGDGQIDRALAAARATVRHCHDWWQPALLMRLSDGQLWADEPSEGQVAASPAVPVVDQRQGVFITGGTVAGLTIGVNQGSITVGQVTQLTSERAVGQIEQLAARAQRRGDSDLAQALRGAARDLDAARRAGHEGNPEQRAAKLQEVRAMLTRYAPRDSELRALLQALQQDSDSL